MIIESAECAWHRIATRDFSHNLEKIGRKVFLPLSMDQWLEILVAICKNNKGDKKVVPDFFKMFGQVIQDDGEIFPQFLQVTAPDGYRLVITPIESGFKCELKD